MYFVFFRITPTCEYVKYGKRIFRLNQRLGAEKKVK
jgi:hypothetical protein